ncbi:hypothetical protein I4U23_029189 [Adineta vaga]|nr:hypothetical protein I4U23_029189 [Adineta vaga]
MVFRFFKQFSANLHRKVRRAFLAEPDKTPERIAIAMASVLFLSIVITYNVLYEKEKSKQGIQPPTVMDLFREHNAKRKLEHLELQRSITQAHNKVKTIAKNDL